jgi:hypothetical protein
MLLLLSLLWFGMLLLLTSGDGVVELFSLFNVVVSVEEAELLSILLVVSCSGLGLLVVAVILSSHGGRSSAAKPTEAGC